MSGLTASQAPYRWLFEHAERHADRRTLAQMIEIREQQRAGARSDVSHELSCRSTARRPSELLPELRIDSWRVRLPCISAGASLDTLLEHMRDRMHVCLDRFAQLSGTAPVVLDIGANEGFFTLATVKRNPHAHIIAVEPVRDTFATLCDTAIRNALPRVHAVRAAVGELSPAVCRLGGDSLCLERTPTVSSVSSRSLSKRGPRWARRLSIESERVPLVSIAELVAACAGGNINLLKIDNEGDELPALRSALPVLRRIERIVIEYHGVLRRRQCRELLETNGFRCVHADRGPVGDIYFENEEFERL